MVKVDAGRIARRFEVVDGRPRTVAVEVDEVVVAVSGLEVAVVVDGRHWADADLVPSAIEEAPGGAALAWTLTGPDLVVRVTVDADGAAGVVRKRVAVSGRGRLERVELEALHAAGGPAGFSGFESTGEPVAYNTGAVGLGQPLFGPGFFAGMEHPVAENLVTGGGAGGACALPVAVDLGPEPVALPGSVLGAGGLDAFWDYLDGLRPVPARLVALTNNWYHLGATGAMDEAAVVAEVVGFAAVAERHELDLDFVALDDGWEGEWAPATGLWGRMAPSRFPQGIGPLGPGIGLWLSPFGGYGERRRARVAWAMDNGLEVEGDAGSGTLCVAGDRYRAHLAEALAGWTRAGVGYWKLDGVRFVCDDPGHGHPVGPGARTAQVDRFLALVAGIRAVRPDAVIAFTIGSHPSPWWLAAVDFVWRGGLDDTAADRPGGRLDRFDTYIDTCLHAYRRAALPVSALVAFAVVESAAASYREPGTAGAAVAWARHCWLAVGRGSLHHDLYVAPDSLAEAEWAVLARALAWARNHQGALARSRMVAGDPGAGEIYGFAGRRGAAGVACLRNPADRRQELDVDWAALVGCPPGQAVEVVTRFGPPQPACGRLTLDPFGVVLVEVTAGSG